MNPQWANMLKPSTKNQKPKNKKKKLKKEETAACFDLT